MILDLQHITFGFSTGSHIFKDLSLTLEAGKVNVLMGGNGAGKTTLFNIITGFIKPKGGTISFNGNNITKLSPYQINRKGIGRTFQDLRIITKLSVRENILLSMKENPTDNILNALLPPGIHHNASKLLEQKADETIGQFFLSQVKDSMAGEISYGEQKLLTLACCVANGASLLLLDEPVAGVQPEYRNKVATLIKQLKRHGKTTLLIEHNTDFISEVADKIFFLHEGEVSIFDSIDSLKKDQQIMMAYL